MVCFEQLPSGISRSTCGVPVQSVFWNVLMETVMAPVAATQARRRAKRMVKVFAVLCGERARQIVESGCLDAPATLSPLRYRVR